MLAVVAVAIRWRWRVVIAFAILALAMAVVTLFDPVVSFVGGLPLLGKVQWQLSLFPLDFAIALLAGIGMSVFVRSYERRDVRYWTGGGFAAAALVLILLWIFGRGHLPPNEAHIRAMSFVWPVVDTIVGIAIIVCLSVALKSAHQAQRMRSWPWLTMGQRAGMLLLICETAFLVGAGALLWSSSSTPPHTTHAERTLASAVGTSLVGLGVSSHVARNLGITPNDNIFSHVDEFIVYDPDLPYTYFTSWKTVTNRPGGYQYIFGPRITSSVVARRYGIAYVLEPDGSSGPPGSVFDRTVGANETLFRIPGSARATLTPLRQNGAFPPPDALGRSTTVTHLNPASWKIEPSSTTAQDLRLRLTDVPGWRATIDGQPLQLDRFSGVMLQARIPAGRHTIELNYWPQAFTDGILLAICSAAGLMTALLVGGIRRRRKGQKVASALPPHLDRHPHNRRDPWVPYTASLDHRDGICASCPVAHRPDPLARWSSCRLARQR